MQGLRILNKATQPDLSSRHMAKKKTDSPGAKLTPMLQQYHEIKAGHPDAILFFRMGDFYEMFYEDAKTAARVLEITLTSRDRNKEDGVPMCGVPVHAADSYLTRLVQAGFRVAICEQVEDPRQAKGLVKREVIRVVTPGLLTAEGSLGPKANNYTAALCPPGQKGIWGLAFVDLSTGEFSATEMDQEDEILAEIFRLEPAELLLPEGWRTSPLVGKLTRSMVDAFVTYRPDVWFEPRRGEEVLKGHFKTLTLAGFGFSDGGPGTGAAGALLSYVLETQKSEVSHITKITPYHLHDFLIIDEATKRNLELVANALDHSRKGTLLDLLDLTVTPMGGRLLKKWILYPLKNLEEINRRLECVEILVQEGITRGEVRSLLRKVYDLERLVGRAVLGTASPRDLVALKQSLARMPELRGRMESLSLGVPLLEDLLLAIDPLEDLVDLIDRAIREDCPLQLRDGGIIREGYDQELDEFVAIQRDGRSFIAGVEAREREKTGISTLKVGFNKVFGYYIEVSKAQSGKVPEHYIRKQTLVSAERYITPELKEVESKILTAQERRLELEYRLFQEIRARVAREGSRIQQTASALAVLDCLCALASAALRYNYNRPVLNTDKEIEIVQGRHPVVEQTMKEEGFVPNDVYLNHRDSQLLVITGPNMAGKSTVLRQTALIVLMAQMGSFVPAERATIGIVDQIFTRVGATDYLARGQSTFMVEMSETANILNNATNRSLVILDEIGRGTSTYDGLAIAWAVAEHLLIKDGIGVKTLFATHYHELTELAKVWKKVQNLHVAVKEWRGRIVFLRQLRKGATNKSYGIQVAALAGVPDQVIKRAQRILEEIERRSASPVEPGARAARAKRRLSQKTLPLIDWGTSES